MNLNSKRKIAVAISIIIIFGTTIASYFFVKDDFWFSLFISLSTSLVSSFLFISLSEFIFNDTTEKIDDLKKITEMIYGLNSKGIREIRGRDEYDYKFWQKFVGLSEEKLIVSGKALNRWLDQHLIDDFTKCLKRLIKKPNSLIQFVIYENHESRVWPLTS